MGDTSRLTWVAAYTVLHCTSVRTFTRRRNSRVQANLATLSRHAWGTVAAQMLRIYVLAKVTGYTSPNKTIVLGSDLTTASESPSVRRGLHLHPRGTSQLTERSSQVHSTEEEVLLGWLSYHHRVVTGSGFVAQTFGDDLADGLIFASVLASHVPVLADRFFGHLYTHPKTTGQRQHNIIQVREGPTRARAWSMICYDFHAMLLASWSRALGYTGAAFHPGPLSSVRGGYSGPTSTLDDAAFGPPVSTYASLSAQ